MPAVARHQLGHEGPQIARIAPFRHGIPVGGEAVVDDRAVGGEVILVKEHADPHVE